MYFYFIFRSALPASSSISFRFISVFGFAVVDLSLFLIFDFLPQKIFYESFENNENLIAASLSYIGRSVRVIKYTLRTN